jgi:hypothetical protein
MVGARRDDWATKREGPTHACRDRTFGWRWHVAHRRAWRALGLDLEHPCHAHRAHPAPSEVAVGDGFGSCVGSRCRTQVQRIREIRAAGGGNRPAPRSCRLRRCRRSRRNATVVTRVFLAVPCLVPSDPRPESRRSRHRSIKEIVDRRCLPSRAWRRSSPDVGTHLSVIHVRSTTEMGQQSGQ